MNKHAETIGSGNNSAFTVVGEGRFIEIGLRSWEDDYYVGVHPRYSVENYEDAINGISFGPSTGKMTGSDASLFLKVQQVLATAALVIEPDNQDFKALALKTALTPDLDDIFGPDTPSYRRNSAYVADSLLQYAKEVVDTEHEDRFEQLFGMSAQDFSGYEAMVNLAAVVFEEIDAFPETIKTGYLSEFEQADKLILEAMRNVTADIFTPTTAWTSARVSPTQAREKASDADFKNGTQSPSGPSF